MRRSRICASNTYQLTRKPIEYISKEMAESVKTKAETIVEQSNLYGCHSLHLHDVVSKSNDEQLNWTESLGPRHSGVRCNVFILECTKHKITWGGTYQNGAAFCDQYFFNDSFMHHNSIDSSQLHFSFGFRIECASQHIARLSVPYIFTNWHNYFLVFAQIKATASVDAFAALFSLFPSRFPSIHIWHSWKTINSITHCISFRYSL